MTAGKPTSENSIIGRFRLCLSMYSTSRKFGALIETGLTPLWWSRLPAPMANAGVEPKTKEYRGKDPLAFVISLNLQRRHLDESQRSLVAAKIAAWKLGDNQHSKGSANLPTQSQAATLLNVSERSVRSARTVLDNGTPELQKAVEQGHLPVSTAAQATKLKPEQQREIAEKAVAGEANARAGRWPRPRLCDGTRAAFGWTPPRCLRNEINVIRRSETGDGAAEIDR